MKTNRVATSIMGLVFILVGLGASHAANATMPLDSLYHQAQRQFHRRNYRRALPLLLSYVEKSKTQRHRRERLIGVIDQIGRIYLRERKDPDEAIAFFMKLSKSKRLNDAEYHVLEEWLAGANEWKRYRDFPEDVKSVDALFERGQLFFRKGLSKQKFRGDDTGDAHFNIAACYLVPFIINFDKDPRIGEALFMMGVVRHNSWEDTEYWSENFYLREVIRRFPHTPLAEKAFKMLDSDVHFGYSGSSGDHTPKSLLRMLEQFKRLAEPQKGSNTVVPGIRQ